MPLQIRRGLNSDRTSVTPSEGELVYSTDTKQLFVGDGTTSGGNQIIGTGNSSSSPISNTGDLIIGNGVNSATRLPIGANNYVLTSNGTTALWQPANNANGIISSITVTVPPFLSVSGSPLTTSGTIAIGLSGTALPTANGGTGATSLSGASIVTYTGIETLTNKRIEPRTFTTTSASTLTPNITNYTTYIFTALATNLTINAPTGTPLDGAKLLFRFLDNGTTRNFTWNATYTAIGVTIPVGTNVNKTTYVGCVYNANSTRWDVIGVSTES
jgi:hypothetical protein